MRGKFSSIDTLYYADLNISISFEEVKSIVFIMGTSKASKLDGF